MTRRRAKATVAQMAKRLTWTYMILAHAPHAGVLMPWPSIQFLVLLLLLAPPNPHPQPRRTARGFEGGGGRPDMQIPPP